MVTDPVEHSAGWLPAGRDSACPPVAKHSLAAQSGGDVLSADFHARVWSDEFSLFPACRTACPYRGSAWCHLLDGQSDGAGAVGCHLNVAGVLVGLRGSAWQKISAQPVSRPTVKEGLEFPSRNDGAAGCH